MLILGDVTLEFDSIVRELNKSSINDYYKNTKSLGFVHINP